MPWLSIPNDEHYVNNNTEHLDTYSFNSIRDNNIRRSFSIPVSSLKDCVAVSESEVGICASFTIVDIPNCAYQMIFVTVSINIEVNECMITERKKSNTHFIIDYFPRANDIYHKLLKRTDISNSNTSRMIKHKCNTSKCILRGC